MRWSTGHGTQGVALITALLMVSLATITMVAMATHQKMQARYTSILIGRDQAWNMVLGGEAWAKAVLLRTAGDNAWDSLDEPWAEKMAPMEVEGATVWGWNEDLQSRFNLNSLVINGKQDGIAMGIFERLLDRLDLDPLTATAVADWIDADSERGGAMGVENDAYSRLKSPYGAANQPMQSATELMLVQGFDAKGWARLQPFVVALPGRTAINVNTAPAELLSALAGNISLSDAQQVVKSRFMEPFKNMESFRNHPNLVQAKAELQTLTEAHVDVKSNFFLVNAQAEVGQGKMILRSLLRRNPTTVVVIRRSMGML
ncbi:MAG: type II secretion system minor pseudopilin GspK [Magnetococcales bacterium]|nr:type II secretion system minor pseudopilin GspK [Magnetococcales bacterium]MBF0629621.1 type II secretion system minor pseudopilin GspK [Magnetococcales bacterium]